MKGELGTSRADAVTDAGEAEAGDRRAFLRRGVLAAGAVGAVAGGLMLSRVAALADSTDDINRLTRASSLENALLLVYSKVMAMPAAVSGVDNPVIKTFMTTAVQHHTAHLQAFTSELQKLGGKPNTGIDGQVLATVVNPGLSTLSVLSNTVTLLLTLENMAAESYVEYATESTPGSSTFTLMATTSPIEASHASLLLATQALLATNAPASLIQLPPPLAALSAGAGSEGFPNSFYPTAQAQPDVPVATPQPS